MGDQRHQIGCVVNVYVIVEDQFITPACDTDETAITNLLILDPIYCCLLGHLAPARNNVHVSEFPDPGDLTGDSGLGRRYLIPILPRLVENPIEIVL
jgi:hypothetical protein